MEDPFYEVKADALAQMENVRKLFESFMKSRNAGIPALNTELSFAIEELNETLEDLKGAIEIAMSNSERYGLDEQELKARRKFITDLDVELNNLTLQMNAAPSTDIEPGPNSTDMAKTALTEDDRHSRRQVQQQLYQQQDVMLDGVYDTVGNIRSLAQLMGQELGEQSNLIDTLDHTIENTNHKLRRGMKRLKNFTVASADSKSGCCITVLIFILIVLLVLIVLL
ncbi:SNARE Tgl1 [Schizosaccharomyces cryophilus OY26]|uniref:t-SNARE affecting a late Golgi compartment protein 1 n=1 Tax=Schizosaccharomyces cryophilus (strain OY26 / ATCC MYA-4695 / CBS 11777 / NBRC 106824 / NRRL Y48691) TaxID=653667 RepID=S9X713_SCHCR|nr:SNARE Tgl1 [Schizosaccharomyces cryophilus OY26]EPY52857.1 SNARE Tgl1 [Schizosaccharomyces cryophilus OY26]